MNAAIAAATACAATFIFCVAALAAVVEAFIIYVKAVSYTHLTLPTMLPV